MKKDWTKWMITTTILSMSLAPSAALAADTGSTAGQTAAPLTFTDYTQISPEKVQAIHEAVDQGLLNGFPDGQFHPQDTLSRQELAVLLARALHLLPETGANASFTDTGDAWATPYIEAVRKAGVMNGDADGVFRPNDPVTREELAAVFVRAVGGVDAKSETKLDLPDSQVSSWADGTVETSVRMGLVVPTVGGFQPKASVEREDIAAFLIDIFKKEERTSVINKIDGDFVTIDGQTMLIDDQLKALFAGKNKEALEGAVLKYTSLNKNVDGLAELEIVNSGSADKPVSLDTTGSSFDGVLRIAGDHISVKGDQIAQVEVKQGVKHVELNAAVDQVSVLSDEPLQLAGNAQIKTLKVDNDKTQITLGEQCSIDTVKVPSTTKTSNIITDYNRSKEQIKNREQEPDSSSSGGNNTNTPAVVNHSPSVLHTLHAASAVAGSGETGSDLTGLFSDSDGDTFTLSAFSSNTTAASVRMVGSTLYITPLAAGTSIITVKARDSKGAVQSTSFTYTVTTPIVVPNLPPVASLLPLTASNGTAGGSNVTVDVSSAFTDDAGGLTYSAVSSDTNVATVSVNGTSLSLTPLAQGTTTITLTVTDAGSLTQQRTFTFTVNAAVVIPPIVTPPIVTPPIVTPPIVNLPPVASLTPLTASNGTAGGSNVTVDVSGAFTDDAGGLTYSAVSSDTNVATVSVNGTSLSLTPLAQGTTTITLTVTDAGSLTQQRTFTFTVNAAVITPPSNQAPVASLTPLTASNGTAGGSNVTVDVSGAFTDDAGGLTYSAVSSDTNVATVSVNGTSLSLTPLAQGTTTITLTVTDAGSLTQQRTFTFTVNAAVVTPPSNQAPVASLTPVTASNGTAGGSNVTVDVSGAFTDDASGLTYSAVSSDTNVATVSVNGTSLSLTPIAQGTTTITLTVTDAGSLTQQRTFTFTVNAAGVTPVEADLQPGAFLQVNSSSGEVKLNTSESTYKYGKRNIKDLLKLTRGSSTLTDISYDSSQTDFNVFDGANQVADITVEASSANITVSDGSSYLTLTPQGGLSAQTPENLTFHVKTIGGTTDDVVLPITVDQISPTITNRNVESDYSAFTYTFSENVIDETGISLIQTVLYSPNGTGNDSMTLYKDTDYTLDFTPGSDNLKITMTAAGQQKASLVDGAKFYVYFYGIADYGYNRITPPDIVTVSLQQSNSSNNGPGIPGGG